jgi:hypothetical protein
MAETVVLKVGKDEALILFELLADFSDEPSVVVRDNAERLALARLGGALESTLVEPFMENYAEIASNARERLMRHGAKKDHDHSGDRS